MNGEGPEYRPAGVTYFIPGTEPYEKLPAVSRYDACCELLKAEMAYEAPRLELVNYWQAEAEFQKTQAALEDPRFDLTHNFWIAPKDPTRPGAKAGLVLLNPNPVQDEFIERYDAAMDALTPVMDLVLKSRQQGGTTVITGLGHRHVTRNGGHHHAAFVAQSDPDMKAIFDKYRIAHDNDTWALKPGIDQANTSEIVFDSGSWIKGRTCKSKNMFRGQTLHFAHTTESAFYGGRDVAVYNAMQDCFSKGGVMQYFWYDESTANGRQGGFYDRCRAALFTPDATPWVLRFLPWIRRWDTMAPEVKMTDSEREFTKNTLTDKEHELIARWNVTLEQIKWRRETWLAIQASDDAERANKWSQEHPVTPHEAFIATGGSLFDPEAINKQLGRIDELDAESPPWFGDIQPDIDTPTEYFAGEPAAFKFTPKPSTKRTPGGPLTRWQKPLPTHKYLIGVDVAEGKKKGDFTVMSVYDQTKRLFVARWEARKFPEDALEPLRLLSRYYNDARINIEVAGFGSWLCRELEKTDRQGCLCLSRDASQTRIGDPYNDRWGWKTTATSKRQLVSLARKILTKRPQTFRDRRMLEQMLLFEESVSEATGKVDIEGATGSNHDDVAMAGMIALMGDEDSGYLPPKDDEPAPASDEDRPLTLRERTMRSNERLAQELASDEQGLARLERE